MGPSGVQGLEVIPGASQTLPRPPVHPQSGPGGKVVVARGNMRKSMYKNAGEGRGQSTFMFLPRREQHSQSRNQGCRDAVELRRSAALAPST